MCVHGPPFGDRFSLHNRVVWVAADATRPESLQAVFRAGESGWPEWGDKCCGCCTGRGCCLRTRSSALAALITMLKRIHAAMTNHTPAFGGWLAARV